MKSPSSTATSPPAASSLQDFVSRQCFPAAGPWVPVFILVALVAVAYRGVVNAGFIWDDDAYLTHNPCIVGPLGFADIWTSLHARICPLVISSFWLQFQLWGLRALPYHLVNVAFHASTAIALWRTLRLLRVPGAWLGAALWAIHPVQVESVAWISELKNTQSGLFYVLCVYFFARHEGAQERERKFYWLAVLFGAAAMASKSSTVVLPPILVLCSWWMRGSLPWKRWAVFVPFVLLALATVALSMWSQNLEGANEAEWARSGPERLITAGRVMWFYLGKLAWPQPLIFIYERWIAHPANWIEWLPLVAGVALIFSLLILAHRPWARAALFASGAFVIALLPVAGLVDHYFLRYSFVGDHFQYLASMGPLALAAAAFTTIANTWGQKSWTALLLLCGVVLVALGMTSAAHVPVFENDINLWADTVERNPDCWLATNNLGVAYLATGKADVACRYYDQVLKAYGGRTHGGTTPNQEPRGVNPIKSATQEGSLYNNLGLAHASLAHHKEALEAYRKAIAVSPANGEAHVNLANELLSTGQFAEAVTAYKKSMPLLKPKGSTFHSLATAVLNTGDVEGSLEFYQKALEMEPNSAVLRYNFGNALAQAGRIHEAVAAYEWAVKREPSFISAAHNLAWVLATTTDDSARNGKRAVEVLRQAQAFPGGKEPFMLRALAAAQFEAGEKEAATQTARNAILLATVSGSASGTIDELKADLDGYNQGKPVRNTPAKSSGAK